MKTNHHELTGIPFGYVSASSLDPEQVDILMYGAQAEDHSYQEALEEAKAIAKAVWEEECEEKTVACQEAGTDCILEDFEFDEDKFSNRYECDEPSIGGVLDGVNYHTTWLGGAPNFWIFHSPFIGRGVPCSPCVPGALDIDSLGEGDYEGYIPPLSWFQEDTLHKFLINFESELPIDCEREALEAEVSQYLTYEITDEQVRALRDYKIRKGNDWKESLNDSWAQGGDHGALLQQVRNTLGPKWLFAQGIV